MLTRALATLGLATTLALSGSAEAATYPLNVNTTSGSNQCIVGNPTEYISTAYVDWIFTNRMKANYDTQIKDFIFDQLLNNNGNVDYCIRWESDVVLTKAVATKLQALIQRQLNHWNEWLRGYNCWPYTTLTANVVGFAVKTASMLDWSDSSLGTIHVGNLDADGAPQCPQECYKHVDSVKQSDTSKCTAKPFDMSLWLTKSFGMTGAGGDWGQRTGSQYVVDNIDTDTVHIVAHEMGHGFGLPDFYETADFPGTDMPACIMQAGASTTVTEGDGWMIRRGWEYVKSQRYASLTSSPTTAPTTTKVTTTAPTTTKVTTTAPTTTKTATTAPTTTKPASGTGAALYGQCGGQGWTGPTTCAQGTCTYSNAWYSQCL